MGKKKKKTSSLKKSASSLSDGVISSFRDEIIQHLQLLKESGGLVVGCNAVLRALRKNSLSVVIFISRRGTSAMYHALNLMSKGTDALFLQFQDINFGLLNLQIPCSTSYGIKTNIIHLPKFSKLLGKINSAKNLQKGSKKKNSEESVESEESCLKLKTNSTETEKTLLKNDNEASEVKNFIHAKHDQSKKFMEKGEGFLDLHEIDFPNYKKNLDGIAISIS